MNTVPALSVPPREYMVLAAIILVFFFVNIATSAQYPVVWKDEVMLADPAANIYLGNGFHTTAKLNLDKEDFYAGAYIYPVLLSGWIYLTDLSPTGVRSFSYMTIVLSAIAIWLAVLRQGLVRSTRDRLLLVLIILLGYGISFSYRGGRHDTLLLLLAAVLFLVFTLRHTKTRYALLAFLSAMAPFAGLQMLPFLAVISLVLLAYLRKAFLFEFLSIGFGAFIGLVGFIGLLMANGALDNYIAGTQQHTSISLLSSLFSDAKFDHRNKIPKDFSLVFLVLAGGILFIRSIKAKQFSWSSPLGFGIVSALCISLSMILVAKLPTYYSWMVFVPLAICVTADLSTNPRDSNPVVRLVLLLALLVGLPLQLSLASYDWEDRRHGAVVEMVSREVSGDDWVYTDYGAYYAAKNIAGAVFLPDYLPNLTPDEREKISVIIIAPSYFQKVAGVMGGDWKPVSEIHLNKKTFFEDIFGFKLAFGVIDRKYRLRLYRRSNVPIDMGNSEIKSGPVNDYAL